MSLLTRDSGGGGRVACGKFGGGGCAVCVLSLVPVSGSCLCLWFLSLAAWVPLSGATGLLYGLLAGFGGSGWCAGGAGVKVREGRVGAP